MPEEHKSFWTTLPGIITAFATLVTAIGGFLVVLNQVGFFGSKSETKKEESKPAGIINQQQAQQLGSEELKDKQAALELKIREMEEQLQRQRQQQSSSSSSQQPSPTSEQHQTRTYQPFSDLAQIGGTWYDADGAYYTIAQVGNQVTLQEYSNVYGVTTVTAAGQGSIVGRVAFINVTTILNTNGQARLQLSDDKNMLTGEYKDNDAGTTTYLRLSKSPMNFGDDQ